MVFEVEQEVLQEAGLVETLVQPVQFVMFEDVAQCLEGLLEVQALLEMVHELDQQPLVHHLHSVVVVVRPREAFLYLNEGLVLAALGLEELDRVGHGGEDGLEGGVEHLAADLFEEGLFF